MNYKKGYTIKPSGVKPSGIVNFTNNAGDDCVGNKATCVAYGYKWDNATGSCRAYDNGVFEGSKELNKTIEKGLENNDISGIGNEAKTGFYNAISGTGNILKGKNLNSLASGEGGGVNIGISNTRTTGSFALTQRQGEDAHGGGNIYQDFTAGQLQTSVIQASCLTTDTTKTDMLVNNIGHIPIQPNCIISFEVYINQLVTGGEGECDAGDYTYSLYHFSAKIKANSQAIICSVAPKTMICGEQFGELVLEQITTVDGEDTIYGDLVFRITNNDCNITNHLVATLLETRSSTNL